MNVKTKILQQLYSLNNPKQFCRLPKFLYSENRPQIIVVEYEFVFLNQESETIPVIKFMLFDMNGNVAHYEPPLTYHEINTLVPYDL
jgi:hypothetical protein